MYIGADYYPEHWPRTRWAEDARLMKEAGFNLVRLAEFAWAFMEPEEGIFDFSLFDEALAILAENGISAIMCTPTAVMPAWLARKYPETLATRNNGERIVWGVRKNNCFTSGAFRLLSERVTGAMAEHFAQTPNVVGWQTDNEFGHPYCHCETCRADFQDWLRRKYGTTERLNQAWGTHFWGHLVNTWGEIVIPAEDASHNPSACLDWHRYFSQLNVRFQRDQVKLLRAACTGHFVTHNFMGLFAELNYYDLAEDLDFVSWDNYPVWGKPDFPYSAAAAADVMRGLKGKNFWIMEQTAGPGGWASFGRNPWPGELRKVAYQQLAHGADGQVWFRWRTCTAGREQYWHGLLGHDGKPLRRYREAAKTAAEYHKLAPELTGTTVKADVAMIYDYESIWALRIQPGFPKNVYHDAMQRYYNALVRAGVMVDMVKPDADLSAYKAVFAPDLYLLPDRVAERLSAYVERGGVLATDCRTGVKDENNLCHARTLPGALSQALGIVIEEYETLPEDAPVGLHVDDADYTAEDYADWARAESAETLATFDHWRFAGMAAATRNRHGKGCAFYLATRVKESAFYDRFVDWILSAAGIEPLVKPPEGVEISCREGQGRKLLFLINHDETPRTVELPVAGLELLSERQVETSLTLEPFGVAVIKLPPARRIDLQDVGDGL